MLLRNDSLGSQRVCVRVSLCNKASICVSQNCSSLWQNTSLKEVLAHSFWTQLPSLQYGCGKAEHHGERTWQRKAHDSGESVKREKRQRGRGNRCNPQDSTSMMQSFQLIPTSCFYYLPKTVIQYHQIMISLIDYPTGEVLVAQLLSKFHPLKTQAFGEIFCVTSITIILCTRSKWSVLSGLGGGPLSICL